MAMTLTISSGSSAVTTPYGTKTVTFTVAGTATPIETAQNLASGNNTVTVPTGSTWAGVIVSPPSTNVVVLTVRGIANDTGLAIPLATPWVHFFYTTVIPATFVINAASATTGQTTFFWF